MAPSRPDLDRWLAQAWHDWIRPLGLLIVAGLGYLAYRFDFLGERPAGIFLCLAILIGLLALGVIPAFSQARRGSDRVMIGVFIALALAGAAWPVLRVAWSPAPLASTHLDADHLKATLSTGADGPYELVVSGRLKSTGATDATASYTIEVYGRGKTMEQVSGEVKRALHRYRTSRRGGSSVSLEEHTESVHRLGKDVRGNSLTVSTDSIDSALEGGLEVGVRSAGPSPEVFWAIAALAILLGLILDVRLVVEVDPETQRVRGPKREVTYLTCVAAMLLVFSINFPMEATPRSLVKPAIGAFFLALLLGGAGGWLVTAFARLAAKPRRKR